MLSVDTLSTEEEPSDADSSFKIELEELALTSVFFSL